MTLPVKVLLAWSRESHNQTEGQILPSGKAHNDPGSSSIVLPIGFGSRIEPYGNDSNILIIQTKWCGPFSGTALLHFRHPVPTQSKPARSKCHKSSCGDE